MISLDARQFGGSCRCGKDHTMVTRSVLIAPGALLALEDALHENGIEGKRCTLYGERTYAATAGRHPYAEQEIILPSKDLHADEKAVARTLAELHGDTKVLIAVGSGTIHDIARYCAHERGLHFVSCPTAASVDGFCSTVAAMTWHGYKKTLPAVAPEIVAADTDVLRAAPIELVRSGVGDILAKYTALADWRMAHVMTGEYFCPEIHDLMHTAADAAVESVDGILRGEPEAFENVTKALLLSGIAMQMMGNSRPASGAEHHIAHLIEMHPAELSVAFPALHGEKSERCWRRENISGLPKLGTLHPPSNAIPRSRRKKCGSFSVRGFAGLSRRKTDAIVLRRSRRNDWAKAGGSFGRLSPRSLLRRNFFVFWNGWTPNVRRRISVFRLRIWISSCATRPLCGIALRLCAPAA